MKLLTNEQQKSYENGKFFSKFAKINLKINMLKIKSIAKLGTIVIIQVNYRGAAHSIGNLNIAYLKKFL